MPRGRVRVTPNHLKPAANVSIETANPLAFIRPDNSFSPIAANGIGAILAAADPKTLVQPYPPIYETLLKESFTYVCAAAASLGRACVAFGSRPVQSLFVRRLVWAIVAS